MIHKHGVGHQIKVAHRAGIKIFRPFVFREGGDVEVAAAGYLIKLHPVALELQQCACHLLEPAIVIVHIQRIAAAEGVGNGSSYIFPGYGIVHKLRHIRAECGGNIVKRTDVYGYLPAFVFGEGGFALVYSRGELILSHVFELAVKAYPAADVVIQRFLESFQFHRYPL